MSKLRYNRAEAVATLRQNCAGMDKLIAWKGAYTLQVSKDNDLFIALARSIIYQQLSGKAAGTSGASAMINFTLAVSIPSMLMPTTTLQTPV